MFPKVAQIVVGLPVEGPFDYSLDKQFQGKISVGQRVCVSFHTTKRTGFVVGLAAKSKFKELKPVLSVLDPQPALSNNLLELTKQFAQNYGCSWGEAIETSLPNLLRAAKPVDLNPWPQAKSFLSEIPQKILLHGQGTQRRWDFLLGYIDKILLKGRSVIFLVPEVSFIEKVNAKLKDHFDCLVAVLDKRLTPKEELKQWRMVQSGEARLAIGTRSAVFAPAFSLGAIIMYEEENFAYKQEQSPFYHAREVAGMRCAIEKSDFVMVSLCPSAESWWQMRGKKNKKITLEEPLSRLVQVFDMSNYKYGKSSVISFPLRNVIEKSISEKQKIVLFLNQRGFSSLTRCNQCGFTSKCPRCAVSLTYLYSKKKLACRRCNFTSDPPAVCPQCNSSYIRFLGMGIEKLESELARIFPQAKVGRFDKETSQLPEADIIIATQAILRRLDEVRPHTIAVLRFDSELNRLDFRSGQRAFALLMHLCEHVQNKLIVQTFNPDSYCVKAAAKMDFDYFYREELKLRKELDFPPFKHLAAVGFRGVNEADALAQANRFFSLLQEKNKKEIELTDPQADIVPKLRDKYRFTIMMKGKSVKEILKITKEALRGFSKRNKVIITVNIDP